jgi:Flp pilus assembly protein TadG
MLRRFAQAVRSTRLARDGIGMVLMEFALALPVMLVMYLGA